MALSLPRSLIEFLLLGPTNDRRQLQDSPILGDVWIAYGNKPDEAVELLITPHREEPAGAVAIAIDRKIERTKKKPDPNIAPLHNIVAACLTFSDVFRVVMPMTKWWHEPLIKGQYKSFKAKDANPGRLNDVISAVVDLARLWSKEDAIHEVSFARELLPAFDRYIALSALVLWAAKKKAPEVQTKEDLARELAKVPAQAIHDEVEECLKWIEKSGTTASLVFQVSRNRPAMPAVARSVPAVKADAARTLFSVNCSKLAWAVIDAGINGAHPAFDTAGVSRVKRAFDFTRIRKIVSLDNNRESPNRTKRIDELLSDDLVARPSRPEAKKLLEQLAEDARNRRPIHWDLVRPFVEIEPATPPASDHGTHVAGIIGASRKGGLGKEAPKKPGKGKRKAAEPEDPGPDRGDFADGMCPDIQLYDFRVLSSGVVETEFAIIAALQFIRYLNARTDYMTIHGTNLSLSIPHDVRNYACGRTPVCLECERLVDSGVVVVAAAGNLGYQSFTTRDGSYEGYAAFSITDPGNADGVLTVGSTHRYAPHTYGVSFFSSRGPTGDGRPKPDLVAPGERIKGPYREGWGDLDGTSMAAPHVSGAAAMLMSRYSELIGQPRRIKQILCKSATDLGRESSFQGNGMLDVLRAFQSI